MDTKQGNGPSDGGGKTSDKDDGGSSPGGGKVNDRPPEISVLPEASSELAAAAQPFRFTAFTRQDLTFRSTDGGRIYGNWSNSFSGACLGGPNNSYIEASAVISQNVMPGPCDTGQRIIRWEYN